MRIHYTLNLELSLDPSDLKGQTPERYIDQLVEEDPEELLALSETVGRVGKVKVVRDEEDEVADDDDDDGLEIIDEDDLPMEDED